MEPGYRLKSLLQLQLASDAYAVLHLPYVLETLSREDLLPSVHTQKWIARVNSLIHAKDPGAKWSGLCLAYQTAVFSKPLVLECAQSWVGAAIPMLQNQSSPTTKAVIRLLRHIFSSATDVPEFQRQLCTPNVPKFVLALISVAETQGDSQLVLLALDTLTHLVPLYPSLSRPMHGALQTLALRHLNGSAPHPTPSSIMEASSRLYAVLPITGGKVGAANLWRKSIEDTIAFSWSAFLHLRSTFPARGYGQETVANGSYPEDPVISIPLALDRLRAGVQVIRDLLGIHTARPVVLPLGSLVRLCAALLQCTKEEKPDGQVDQAVYSLESSVIPTLWALGCTMVVSITETARHHVTPYVPLLVSLLAYHLEQAPQPTLRLAFLRAAHTLISKGSQIHDAVISSRLARAAIPSLATVLSKRPQSSVDQDRTNGPVGSKKGKKRARGYEGDEVFKVTREVICSSKEDGEVIVASVQTLSTLLHQGQIAPSAQSIVSRVLLAVYVALPQLPPALLSSDLSLHSRLYSEIQQACITLARGTSSTLGKGLGLILTSWQGAGGAGGGTELGHEIDLLLHPRVPPLVRSLPHVESLSLFRAEESQEELEARTALSLARGDERDAEGSQMAADPDPYAGAPSNPPFTATANPSSSLPPPSTGTNRDRPSDAQAAMHVDPRPLPNDIRHNESSLPASSLHPTATATHSYTAIPTSVEQKMLPPPPDPVPSASTASGRRSDEFSAPPPAYVQPAPVRAADEQDDEPMPTIDMDSDSDQE